MPSWDECHQTVTEERLAERELLRKRTNERNAAQKERLLVEMDLSHTEINRLNTVINLMTNAIDFNRSL